MYRCTKNIICKQIYYDHGTQGQLKQCYYHCKITLGSINNSKDDFWEAL